jgi:ATP-binding cassette subfamily F protein uup
VVEYVGGYNDWVAGGGSFAGLAAKARKLNEAPLEVVAATQGMSFDERKRDKAERQRRERELAKIPDQIDVLEEQVAGLQAVIAAPNFFQLAAAEQDKHYASLAAKEDEMASLMVRWEVLEQEG